MKSCVIDRVYSSWENECKTYKLVLLIFYYSFTWYVHNTLVLNKLSCVLAYAGINHDGEDGFQYMYSNICTCLGMYVVHCNTGQHMHCGNSYNCTHVDRDLPTCHSDLYCMSQHSHLQSKQNYKKMLKKNTTY